jgi:hypothetical protein
MFNSELYNWEAYELGNRRTGERAKVITCGW